MNITEQLGKRNIEYEIQDGGKVLTFMDAEGNLGVMLKFDRFELRYHFWDANGCIYSPERPFIDLDEMLGEFDKLIFSYYKEPIDESLFADWIVMEFDGI
jgi:hypothetical protein